jgi:lysophospholipase L1-like esterase
MNIAFIGDSLTKGIPGSSYVTILRSRLPQHRLLNLGKGNDTVVSLYRRLSRLRCGDTPFDIAFLWVGVNDIDRDSSWAFRVANALRRQPRSRDLDDFRLYYGKILDILCQNAVWIVAVSPLLKGEDIHNRWNQELSAYAEVVRGLSMQDEQMEYLDLRQRFFSRLATQRVTDYSLKSPLSVGLDALTLRSDAQVDEMAAKRGLHLTLDGVHLNSAGAFLVAEAFLEVIGKYGG